MFKKTLITVLLLFSLIITGLSSFAAENKGKETEIQYAAKDSFNLVGTLIIPKGVTLKKRPPLVIMLHSLGSGPIEWGKFPAQISQSGYAVLNLNMRGHGKSIIDRRNKKRYWQNFTNKDFAKFPADVTAGIEYIRAQYPEINTSKTAIVGAGLGTNIAIFSAYKTPNKVKGLVLISPQLTYKGLDPRIPIAEYGKHPVLFVVNPKNRIAYANAQELYKYAQGKKELKTYAKGIDGMEIIQFQPDSKSYIINWLKKNI